MASDTIIHSGHFMVSSLCDEEELDTFNLGNNVDSDNHGFDFNNATTQLSRSYVFGNQSTNMLVLDPSLSKMFECMTLAYR